MVNDAMRARSFMMTGFYRDERSVWYSEMNVMNGRRPSVELLE